MLLKLSKNIKMLQTCLVYSNYSAFSSIQNYLKTFSSQQVSRHHNVFKVDENISFIRSKAQIKQFQLNQRQNYSKISQKWKHITDKYYQSSSLRKDNRIKSIPETYDQYQYYTKVNWYQGKQYTTIHRKLISQPQSDELVVDIMSYAYIRKYFKTTTLHSISFSQSHRYVAFSFDLQNNEQLIFMIKDMQTNEILTLKGFTGIRMRGIDSIIFKGDQGIYYTKTDKNRPYALFYQSLDGQATQIYRQYDMQYYLGIQKSKDKQYLFINPCSKSSSEILYINISTNNHHINTLKNRGEERQKVNHIGNYFINYQQKTGRVTAQISPQSEILVLHTHGIEESVIDLDVFYNSVVLYMYGPCLRVLDISGLHKIPQSGVQCGYYDASLPFSVGSVSPGTNQSYNADSILCYVNNPFVYNECYQYNLVRKQFRVLEKSEPTGPKFKFNNYSITKHEVPSTTTHLIPLTIISKKQKVKPNKLILYVYGYYGLNNQVNYNHIHLSALEQGWTIAYAHVRGGAEKGHNWHQQALINRDRSWKDLEECVGYLLRQQYTHPSLLCLSSHSAGAITVWNAINRKPHLYKAAILNQPFLDVLNTLLDDSQPLNVSDYPQFGNPKLNQDDYFRIESYCPYQNIQRKQYPFIYIVAAENDYRCKLSQIIKFVRRFRKTALCNGRFSLVEDLKGLMLRIDIGSSHQGSSNISQQNYNGCETFAVLDYLIQCSKDCKLQ